MPHVRENYITMKYLYRKYLRKEVGDEHVSGTFTNDVFAGINSGAVIKKSPGNHLTPWQPRYLKFHSKDGEPVLAYYKDSSYTKAQGEISLTGTFAGLVDPSEAEKDHKRGLGWVGLGWVGLGWRMRPQPRPLTLA